MALHIFQHEKDEVYRFTIRVLGRYVIVATDRPGKALALSDHIEDLLTSGAPKEPRQVGFSDDKEH